MEVLAVKPTADFVDKETLVILELATLSCDPALTFRPDPAFRAKFRNADEIMEGDLECIAASPRLVFTAPPPPTGAAPCRRCPKD